MTETAPAPRTLVIERELPHPPEKVWRALTLAPLIEDWLMKTDFEPVVGRRFQFRAEPSAHWDGIIEGEVLEVEPNRRLAYSWSSLGVNTVVAWTIIATAGGARVRMEQSGFAEGQERAYQGASYGWARFLDGLARVVERI